MSHCISSTKKTAAMLYIAAGLCLAFAAEAGEDAADTWWALNASVRVMFYTEGNGNITATVVDGGEIKSGAMVSSGKNVRFTAVPDDGYGIDQWQIFIDGRKIVNPSKDNSILVTIDGIVTYDVVVSFKPISLPQAKVMFGAGAGGTLTAAVDGVPITPGSLLSIGKKVVFSADPYEGYAILHWSVAGAEIVDSSSAYRREVKISAAVAVDVAVSFERIPRAQVTFDAGAGWMGTLTAVVDGAEINSGDSVIVGKDVVFKAVPDNGYVIAGWTVNGVDTSSARTLAVRISDTASVNVTVSFEVFVPEEPVVKIGPNPVKAGGEAVIYWFGGYEVRGSLSIFDAVGYKADRDVKVNGLKKIGAWKVGNIARGTYLIKGVLKDKDGNKIDVAVPVGVVR